MAMNVYQARNEAREERRRDLLEAGLMSDRFPGIDSIAVTMTYRRSRCPWVLRTVTFIPTSPAFFRISCLGEGCESGALDLTWVVARMVRGRETTASGELTCENRDERIEHPQVDYNLTITYA